MIWRFLAPGRARYLGMWVVLLTLTASAAGASLRVTTWNLQPNAAVGATGWSQSFQQSLVQEAGTTLAALQPDVILLQQVANWESCDQITKALLPMEYHIVVCSSFREAGTGALSRQQVAILSKSQPYLAWPDAWRSGGGTPALPGGYVFAAMRMAGHNADFFSVQFGEGVAARTDEARTQREEAVGQLIEQIAALGNWATNRLEWFLVGGDFNTTLDDPFLRSERTLPRLEALGFANAFAGISLDQRVTLPANSRRPDATVDYIFSRGARQIGRPLISRTALAEHCAVTCEMDFSSAPAARVEISPANQAGSPVAAKTNAGKQRIAWLAEALAGCLTVIVAALWAIRFRRLRQHPAKWPQAKPQSLSSNSLPNAAAMEIAPPSASGCWRKLAGGPGKSWCKNSWRTGPGCWPHNKPPPSRCWKLTNGCPNWSGKSSNAATSTNGALTNCSRSWPPPGKRTAN